MIRIFTKLEKIPDSLTYLRVRVRPDSLRTVSQSQGIRTSLGL
jgi:hypothetical protein